jgi:hypothetical protein
MFERCVRNERYRLCSRTQFLSTKKYCSQRISLLGEVSHSVLSLNGGSDKTERESIRSPSLSRFSQIIIRALNPIHSYR